MLCHRRDGRQTHVGVSVYALYVFEAYAVKPVELRLPT